MDNRSATIVCFGFSQAMRRNLPREFVGIWIAATEGDNQCPSEIGVKWRTQDTIMRVSLSQIEGWEFSCKIVDSRRLGEGTLKSIFLVVAKVRYGEQRGVHVRALAHVDSLRLLSLRTFDCVMKIEANENLLQQNGL